MALTPCKVQLADATSLKVMPGRLDAIDDKLIVNFVVPVDAVKYNLTTVKMGILKLQNGVSFEIILQVELLSSKPNIFKV